MFTRPADLPDDAVATALRDGWAIDVDEIDYAVVGFGSHHWHAATKGGRWFLTVDDVDGRLRDRSDTRSAAKERLIAALSTALSLRSDGCDFVVAPVPSESGQVVELIDDHYVLAVYPHVEGVAGSYGRFDNRLERFGVVDCLVEIHGAVTRVPVQVDDFSIPGRDRLSEAMGEISEPWLTGPFGESTRELLKRHQGPLQQVLAAYDELVSAVCSNDGALVITHGEPHRGNVILSADGPMLIDWDTTLLAPPERDLWCLIDEDPGVRDQYERGSERTLDDTALQMFRLWWDLCEVSLFVHDFRRSHRDTEDTRTAWRGLEAHLDPHRWLDVI